MGRALLDVVAAWVAISIPAALIFGRLLARAADLALAVQPVQPASRRAA
jgi:hypothetical protein